MAPKRKLSGTQGFKGQQMGSENGDTPIYVFLNGKVVMSHRILGCSSRPKTSVPEAEATSAAVCEGLVESDRWGLYPEDSYLNRENDDSPMDMKR